MRLHLLSFLALPSHPFPLLPPSEVNTVPLRKFKCNWTSASGERKRQRGEETVAGSPLALRRPCGPLSERCPHRQAASTRWLTQS